MIDMYSVSVTLDTAQKPITHWQQRVFAYADGLMQAYIDSEHWQFNNLAELEAYMLDGCKDWQEYSRSYHGLCEDGCLNAEYNLTEAEFTAYTELGHLPLYDGEPISLEELRGHMLEDAFALITKAASPRFCGKWYMWLFSAHQ